MLRYTHQKNSYSGSSGSAASKDNGSNFAIAPRNRHTNFHLDLGVSLAPTGFHMFTHLPKTIVHAACFDRMYSEPRSAATRFLQCFQIQHMRKMRSSIRMAVRGSFCRPRH